MAKEQISLYIDDAAAHVMVSRGRQPQKWSSLPLEPGLVKDGLVRDQAVVAGKLKELWQSSRLGQKRVGVAVSGLNCLYQLLTLPELPENLISEAISREASQSLGITLEEVYLSWQVLSVEHGQMRVYLTVLPREVVDALVATLRHAGLKPYLMDIKPLCLARASSESRAVIVDTQADSFDIVVLAEGIPEVVRSLSFPQEASAGEKSALLKAELERAIAFYNSGHMDKPIDLRVPIMISGEMAQQQDDWEALRGPRERPVQALVSPLEDRDGFEAFRYMTNIGLALKEILVEETGAIAYSLVNFNALPEIYRARRSSLSDAVWLPTVVVGILLVGAGFWGSIYVHGQNGTLSADVDAVNQRIAEQGVGTADLADLTAQVKAVVDPASDYSTMLSSLEANRLAFTDDLAEINDQRPVGVSLDGISMIKDKAVTVNGSASSEVDVFDYALRLKDGGRFSSVIVNNITVGEGGKVSFSITLGK
jgi:type IV pilus assembly protein PilM